MSRVIFINLFLILCFSQLNAEDDFVNISGIVSDFEGNPIDSAIVELKHSDFQTAYETLTNSNGWYSFRIF